MSKTFAGIRAVSFYNPANGQVVQVSVISPDSEFSKRPVMVPHPNGMRQVWTDSLLRVGFADIAGKSTLESWQRSGTLIRAVAVGLDTHIQWYESVPIEFESGLRFNARDGVNYSYVTLRHFGTNPAIYNNANLLAFFDWTDANSNNLADGYTLTGATASSFTSGIQTLANVASANGMYVDFEFPITGFQLVKSFDVTALHSVSTYHRMTILTRNFSASTLATINQDSATTGIKSVSFTPAASVYSLRVFPIIGNGTGSAGTVAGRNPALTVGRITPGTTFMGY